MIRSVQVVEVGSVDAFGEITRRLATFLIEISPTDVERLSRAVRRGEPAVHVLAVDVGALRQLTEEAGVI